MIGLYLTSLYSYLLFHTLVEVFSIVVACGIFMIAWNSHRFLDNNYLLFTGIAYLFIGGIDLLHTLAYKNMGVFPGFGANLPTQLWIAARYLQGFSLLAAPLFLGRRLNPRFAVAGYTVAVSLLLLSIFTWRVFPDCFVEGVGLTLFKKVSEYIIAALLVASLAFLLRKRRAFHRDVVRLLTASIVLLVLAELAFTLYNDVYGISNMAGHFFKLIAFYLIYKALIETGLARPYDLLFRELKLSEERLAAKADELEEVNLELEAANLELEVANQELEETNREMEAVNAELEAFSHSVSHDLRAPLSNINGSCQVLTELCADKLDEQSKRFIHYIHEEIRRMDKLIAALLKFSKVTRQELHREESDLSNMASAVATDLQMRQPGRRVTFTIAEGVKCCGDTVLLRVVMENLLGNAWKYTGKEESASIEFGMTESEEKPVYFVRDNGAGFDMGEAHRLFGAFQRLHDRSEFEGTGIGLATVQRIIQRHGGRIWAEGEAGKGATFFFTL
ncbi:MAG: multi-sensor signal transduction histidine [Geobacteraceae bacterium]|nr:MAG: multi-sensor signal transduction histidine [Geobacteraceae bacterium]